MKASRNDVFVGIFYEKMDVVRCDYIIQYAKTITMVWTWKFLCSGYRDVEEL